MYGYILYHPQMAADWENMYATYSENKPIRRTTLKRSTTLPGTADESTSITNPANRPSSSDINKVDASPSTVRRHYVNLAGTIPSTKRGDGHEDPLYVNLPIRKSEGDDSSSSTYENWSPKIISGGNTKLKSNQYNPSISLVLKKPIPPPLLVKRHELKSNQAEAQRIGSKTDSFIVPTIPDDSNYSLVTFGKALDTKKNKKETIKEHQGNQSQATERNVVSSTSTASTENSDDNDGPESRRSTLTPDGVKRNTKPSNGSNDTHYKESTSTATTTNSRAGTDEGRGDIETSLNSHTMSKLAKLTQLPSPGRKDGGTTATIQDGGSSSTSSVATKTKKTFSYHNSSTTQVNKTQATPSRSKGSLKYHYTSNSVDTPGDSHSELVKKLSKQRQKVERQLSTENDSDTQGLSRLADSLLSKDDLSKFGIVEDESGGSFVV